jgi:hypothetical protein
MAFKPELIEARKKNKLTRKDISKIAEIIEETMAKEFRAGAFLLISHGMRL